MARLRLGIFPDPSPEDTRPYEGIIEASDAVILCGAALASVDRLVTLNTKDFTQNVAEQSGVAIQTHAQFIEEVRKLVTAGL